MRLVKEQTPTHGLGYNCAYLWCGATDMLGLKFVGVARNEHLLGEETICLFIHMVYE
jgi:hypothetical protein